MHLKLQPEDLAYIRSLRDRHAQYAAQAAAVQSLIQDNDNAIAGVFQHRAREAGWGLKIPLCWSRITGDMATVDDPMAVIILGEVPKIEEAKPNLAKMEFTEPPS